MPEKYRPLPSGETSKGRQLHLEPAYREAINLLRQNLVLTTPKGERIELGIAEVEPFNSIQAPSDGETFDSHERNYGDVLILWRRGNPMLNIVIDPATRALVCIRKVMLNGEPVSFRKALEELMRKSGKRRIDDEKVEEFARKLDGSKFSLSSPGRRGGRTSVLGIAEPAASEIATLRKVVGDRAENSLGLFANVGRIQSGIHDRAMGAGAIE